MSQIKLAAPTATTAKRGPGRPKKNETPPAPVKRGPGRPKKEAVVEDAPAPAKRGPGRPKVATPAAPAPATEKKAAGRPKKESHVEMVDRFLKSEDVLAFATLLPEDVANGILQTLRFASK